MSCIREHETNCQWLMELLGQIQNAMNKKTDADNQQVRTTTIIPPQKFHLCVLNSEVLKAKVNNQQKVVVG